MALYLGEEDQPAPLELHKYWNSQEIHGASTEAVTFAYEASGSHGLRNPSRLQRCFRDLYVGTSHLVFDEGNYVEMVKPRLGLEPLPF